jgi:hypothetical protein
MIVDVGFSNDPLFSRFFSAVDGASGGPSGSLRCGVGIVIIAEGGLMGVRLLPCTSVVYYGKGGTYCKPLGC